MFGAMLSFVSWHDLPVIATWLFIAMFVTVLVRVCQRKRWGEYDRMASLPLDDGAPVSSAPVSSALADGAIAQEDKQS